MAPGIMREHESDSASSPGTASTPGSSLPELPLLQHLQDELEPIAIVGFSLKFPQEATSPDAFWSMILEKRNAMTEWPRDRLNIDAFYHPDSSRNDTLSMRGGHFLAQDLGAFDAPFFSITAAEAECMDPQHRILLETAYRALENSGIPMEKALGSNTAVYTGAFADDFKLMTLRDVETLPKYAITGEAMSLLANRLSWFFNFNGPSMNIDTACSSSMVALDIACQGLRNRDSRMALVTGSNLIFGLENFLTMSNMNFFSPDAKCFSFDDRANGYSRGEGFGVLVIKTLNDAIQDGDTIRAVIRSTGSNQDGRTPGITQPSGDAQARLIRHTYEKAGLDLKSTRYFEAHGTGTAIGDPTEANAIGGVFRKHRSSEDPLYIGAVKSNIGHLEGSAAMAGIIKAIMVLEKGVIPPNTNFKQLNPKIDAEFLNLTFPTEIIPWPSQGLRRASVNAFGFGGSNSHVILDDAYNYLRLRGLTAKHCTVEVPPSGESLRLNSLARIERPLAIPECSTKTLPKLLVFSAADEKGLTRMADVYTSHFAKLAPLQSMGAEKYLRNLAYTLSSRRTALSWKAFALCSSIADIRARGISITRAVRSSAKHGAAFVFTGQGAQFATMGKELLVFDVFKNTLKLADLCLRDLGCQWSLLDELSKTSDESRVNEPDLSQPLCTALQISLVELLRTFNINPTAVVGHSSGEIAAAYCMGGLSMESACKVAYHRGRLAGELARSENHRGAMMAVGLSEEGAKSYLERLQPISLDATIACINSPNNVTVSGDVASIDALKVLLDAENVFARKLVVDVAYHSPQMNEIAEEYLSSIQNLQMGHTPSVSPIMVSSVTGSRVTAADLGEPQYWVRNMVSPVRFSEAVSQLASQPTNARKKIGAGRKHAVSVHNIVELGPHSALRGPVKSILETLNRQKDIAYDSILVRGVSAVETTLQAVGKLYCCGYPIALEQVNQLGSQKELLTSLTDLPEYPFDHSQTYWYESRISEGLRLRKHGRLDLLGTPVSDWNPLEGRWRKVIRMTETPWVRDHQVSNAIIYPAAAMFSMAVEAAKQTADQSRRIKGYLIEDATFHNAVHVPDDDRGLEVQFYMRPIKESSEKSCSWSEYRLCTYEDAQWVENCRGTIQVQYEEEIEGEVDRGSEAAHTRCHFKELFLEKTKACNQSISPERMYQHFLDIGMGYGPAFQALENITFNDHGEAMAEVKTFNWASHETAHYVQPHIIHPVTLDAAAQLIFLALTDGAKKFIPTTIPTRVRHLWVSSHGLSFADAKSIKAYTKSAFKGYRGTDSSLFAVDSETAELRMMISSLETTTVASRDNMTHALSSQKRLCYGIDLKPDIDMLPLKNTAERCKASHSHGDQPIEFYGDMKLLMLASISRTLDQLAHEDVLNLKPHLGKYVSWMRLQVDKFAGEVSLYDGSNGTSLFEDSASFDSLASRVSSSCREGKLFAEVARSLSSLLQGRVDPLGFLFEDGLAGDYYKEIFNTACSKQMKPYLEMLAHKKPGMNILEIGAGTGGFSELVLSSLTINTDPSLPKYARYDYTDISGSYFEKAEKTLGEKFGCMNFTVLDIEKDPLAQGFEAESYDLIVAGLVLHATRSLDVTMQNVRKLLKPGGKLILFEIVVPDILRTGFVFGLLEGWWLGTESYREWTPCVSEKKWHEVLSQTGFSGVDFALHDHEDKVCHEMGVIVSTASELASSRPVMPDVVIVVDAISPSQINDALELSSNLSSTFGLACDIISMREASLTSSELVGKFVICLPELEKPLLREMGPKKYVELKALLSTARQILWVTAGGGKSFSSPELGMVDGLSRVLRSENTQLVFVTLALDTSNLGKSSARTSLHHIVEVFQQTASKPIDDVELEYVEIEGALHINRMVEAKSLNAEIHAKTQPQPKLQGFGKGPPLAMTVAKPGLLDSLLFVEDSLPSRALAPNEVEIEVKAVGVNFMDCLTVLGRVNKSTIGGECAGIVSRAGVESGFKAGDRVCGAILDCFRTFARSDAQLVTRIPEEFSFAEAGSIPVTGVTTHYALIEFARLQKGETILIHSASGGTGQLAIQMAQAIGAEVFVTVGSDAKKELLTDAYGIPADHVLYSRDTSFAQGIMRMTSGRGVDVVLNSLSGDALEASWDCIASFGRFIEIGKKDIHSHAKLSMYNFRKNVFFGAVDLDHMHVERPAVFRKSLLAVVDMLSKGKLQVAKPLLRYPISEVEDALRHMQAGKHMGKIVVEIESDAPVQTLLSSKPTYDLRSDATYVIVGGLGGIGRRVATWMADRGAKNLLLLSRSGPREEAAFKLITDLESKGVRVEAPACDVTNEARLSAVLKDCTQSGLPPIRGAVQGAMVLRDALFENMTFDEWRMSVEAKVQGSWNLHHSLPRGDHLDFFIMLSSISGIIGNTGQANYAAGNTYEDALAKHRVARGEKAVSIDLGWVESVGKVAENEELQKGVSSAGYLLPISEEDLLALLDHYCDPSLPLPSPTTCQTVVGLATPRATLAAGASIPTFMQRPTYRHMHQLDIDESSTAAKSADPAANYPALLAGASSLAEGGAIVTHGLTTKLSKALRMPAEDIDTSKPLHAYGVDSLLAVELRNWFAKEMGSDVAIFDIMGGASIAAVGGVVAGRSSFKKGEWVE